MAYSGTTCGLFYNMYFSGCLHKPNTKVAFILIFKVAALAAYDFSTLSANQQRERGPVSKAGRRRQQVCAARAGSAICAPCARAGRSPSGGVDRPVVRRL